jgi:UDP-N-acetylmuramoyl-L-alanyl-D-glutamate--2,6-diaminopimelate ligase
VAATLDERGIAATLATPAGPVQIQSPLVGDYNMENIVLATGVACAMGIEAPAIAAGVAALSGVPGRLQRVANGAGILCVVDYAHTPDALERALGALRRLTRRRLIVVFGCGGDRDPGKRPLMGFAAARLADLTVVTSDNPRSEDAAAIVEMILPGVHRAGPPEIDAAGLATAARGFHVEVDRGHAIAAAVRAARAGDTVLLAGKGHEDYQIVGDRKAHFDDREEASRAFAAAALEGGA